MIYYLTAARHAGAMGQYLQTWGKSLAGRIRILSYEQIFSGSPVTLTRGTYIFSCAAGASLGSCDPPSRERLMVGRLRSSLAQQFGEHHVLNDPLKSLRRLALLRTLHKHGINRFSAYRAGEVPRTVRFPVFLRKELGAQWDHTPLLRNRAEYEAAIAREDARADLLAVEFCDTADAEGIYRKYGAFVVGPHIVPRHLFFSRNWMVKVSDLTGPGQLAEELDYLETNPHVDALREVCRLANVGYGRIDYAVRNGRVQVWEINTTPTVAHPPDPDDAVREPVHERFTRLFCAALDAIENTDACGAAGGVPG